MTKHRQNFCRKGYINMKMIDNCGCDNWSVAFAKYLFEKNHIPCEEAQVVYTDDKWMTVVAEIREQDPNTGKTVWAEKEYTIKYWVDWKCLFLSAVSFRFFEKDKKPPVDSDGNIKLPILMEYIDQGNYWVSSFGGCVRFKKFRD